MTRMLAYTTLALALVLGTHAASATHYTFQPNWGLWDNPDNWEPWGTRDGDDEATIPGGKVCAIENRDEAIWKLNIASQAALEINNDHALTFSSDPGNPSRFNLDGYLEAFQGETGRLVLNGSLTVGGTGRISTTSTTHAAHRARR